MTLWEGVCTRSEIERDYFAAGGAAVDVHASEYYAFDSQTYLWFYYLASCSNDVPQIFFLKFSTLILFGSFLF